MDLGLMTQASQRDGQIKNWNLASGQTLNEASLGALTSAEGHMKTVVGDDNPIRGKRHLRVRRA